MSIAGLTEKQYLYEYDPRQGDGWWIKPVPVAEPWFQEELTRFSGLHDGRRPRLRLVWAGDLLHDITHEPQLKYKAVREITVGYFYKKLNGEIGTTKSMNLAKDAAWPWEFHPKTRRLELGRLRWAIERHVPVEQLRRQKRFDRTKDAEGNQVLRTDYPEEGIYEHFFWIQTATRMIDWSRKGRPEPMRLYREPDREVLMAVEAMYLYNTTVSEAQQALDAIEREEQQTLIGADEALQVWSQL